MHYDIKFFCQFTSELKTEVRTFSIQQDDKNRAIQEFLVFGIVPTPTRGDFKTVDSALFVGDTAGSYSINNWLDQGSSTLLASVKLDYGTPIVRSSWRSPYVNCFWSGVVNSKHLVGKAIDVVPTSQAPQEFHDQWNTMKTKADLVILENVTVSLRYSTGEVWVDLPETDPNFVAPLGTRKYDFIPSGQTLELGYQYATHYHLEKN